MQYLTTYTYAIYSQISRSWGGGGRGHTRSSSHLTTSWCFDIICSFCYLGLSSADEGTAMAMESSHPLMEAFQGEEFEEEEEELEEDMVCKLENRT